MKTWLRKYKQLVSVVVVCLLSTTIVAMIHFFPLEPEVCALCGEGTPYHAPVLLNLATGEMGELRVYQNDMAHPGKLAADQRDGYMQFLYYGSFTAMVDGGRSCHVTLPTKQSAIKRSLYCNDCWELLSMVSTKGFVLLDLYVPDDVSVYPITDGAEYIIRNYTVSIACNEQSRFHVELTRHLEFRWRLPKI